MLIDWLSDNYIEVFGAVAGVVYIFLEIRANIWLWPVGIITSAVYVWVFFNGKLYADMSLQVYYVIISILGWIWWIKGTRRQTTANEDKKEKLQITNLKLKRAYCRQLHLSFSMRLCGQRLSILPIRLFPGGTRL